MAPNTYKATSLNQSWTLGLMGPATSGQAVVILRTERERLHVNNYRKAVGEDSHVTSVCRLDPKGDEDKDVEQQRQEEQDVVPPNSGGRGEEGRYSPAQLQRSFLFTKLTGMR